MRKYVPALLCFTLVATFAFAKAIPQSVTINAAAKKQPAVTFPHEQHATKLVKSCDTCHHTQKGLKAGTDVKVEKCSTCHLDPTKAGVPSMREMAMAKNPFHKVCVDCHKEQKKGPVACNGCHKKA